LQGLRERGRKESSALKGSRDLMHNRRSRPSPRPRSRRAVTRKKGSTAPGRRPRAAIGSAHQKMHEASWSREEALSFLESPDRATTQNPARLWRRVGLRPGETVVDVGAGSGFFSFPALSIVGPRGAVYAVDVSPELVELVRERAVRAGAKNLSAVLSTATRIPLEDGVADLAILANVLHGVPASTVDEAIRLLRPGGRLVNVDWKKLPTPTGPPVRHRLSESEAAAAFESRGLTRRDSFELGPDHYVLVFERPAPARRPRRLVSAE
jgi:ubiquinone/menaquinone biosynthesis C-methylase UbiE